MDCRIEVISFNLCHCPNPPAEAGGNSARGNPSEGIPLNWDGA
ncbi:hypothetical protein [Belliella calami]|nr:hypothetical protein [Belliella calami]